MKRVILTALLVSLTLAIHGPGNAETSNERPAPDVDKGETLADAVVRTNKEVEDKYAVLSPTPITESKLKQAIEVAAAEVVESNFADRTTLAYMLTQIASTGQIPKSVRLCFSPITGSHGKKEKDKSRDGRHVSISLNYALLVPSVGGYRLIGLTQIVEIFQVIKPQEQQLPFLPPPQKPETKQQAR